VDRETEIENLTTCYSCTLSSTSVQKIITFSEYNFIDVEAVSILELISDGLRLKVDLLVVRMNMERLFIR